MPEALDKRGALRYCWKAAEEVKCPKGCYCMTEAAALLDVKLNRVGHDQYHNLMYCFQDANWAGMPTGRIFLTKDDAYKRYDRNAKLFRR